MSYNYLLDLYTLLDNRLDQIKQQCKEDGLSENSSAHLQGRRDCLLDIKMYLRDNYHSRLPRRIQKIAGLKDMEAKK